MDYYHSKIITILHHTLISASLLWIFMGCNTNNTQSDSDINPTIKTAQVVGIDSIKIGKDLPQLTYIGKLDNHFILFGNSEDYQGLVLNNNFEIIHPFGRKGFGPGEYNRRISSNNTGIGDDNLYIVDPSSGRTNLYKNDTDSLILENSIDVRYKGQGAPLNRPRMVNDSVFIIDSEMMDNEFEHYVLNTKNDTIIDKFGEYPAILEGEPHNSAQNFIKKNDLYQNKLVTAYQYYDIVKIHNIDNGSVRTFNNEDELETRVSFDLPRPKIIRSFVHSKNDFFYILKHEYSESNNSSSKQLFIEKWDYEGDEITKYELPVAISSFWVEGNTLIGVNWDNGEYIYEIELD